MRVLHIINHLSSGGAQKLLIDIIPLLKNDVDVDLLVLSDEVNVYKKELKKLNIKLYVISINKIYNPLNIWYIRNFISTGNYDIVHTHLFPTNYWTSLAWKLIFRKKDCKLITTEHNTHNRRREKRIFKYIDKFIYSSYDRIFSISQKTQENLVQWLNPHKSKLDKFIIIENGIDLNRFKKARPYLKAEINSRFTENTKLLCMIGRFHAQKDQMTIIEAMKSLSTEIHLLLIGEGPLKSALEYSAKKLGVSSRVHFLGFRKDVERILKTVDISIVSSHWEGFGLVAAEGMAAGKPVIASDVPGLKEVVQGAGITFTRGKSDELSVIINDLLSNNKYYKKVAKKCIEKSNIYSIRRMANEYIREYYKS